MPPIAANVKPMKKVQRGVNLKNTILQTTCAAISDIPEIEKFRYKAPGTYFKYMLIML